MAVLIMALPLDGPLMGEGWAGVSTVQFDRNQR